MKIEAMLIPIKDRENAYWLIPRDLDAMECKCGGYAKRVDCTVEECAEFTCGWDCPGDECCARAFVCKVCKARIVGKAAAPDF